MKRHGHFKTAKFPQRLCDYYTSSNGLLDNKAYCLAGHNGNVYIGTEKGLNYTKSDGSLGAFPCASVKAIYAFNDKIYFAAKNIIHVIENGEISEFQTLDEDVITFSGTETLYLITPEWLYRFEEGKFVKYFKTESELNDIAITGNKINAATSNYFICVNGKRKRWMNICHEHSSMPEFNINCIEHDNELGFTWLGTDKGVYIYDGKTGWYGHNELNALPEEEIFRIRFADDGRVILSSDAGLIILKNGKRKYLPATRWALDPKLNDAIAVNGTIWTATDSGVTKITEKDMTLAEKADYCFELTEKYYLRTKGYVTGLNHIQNADISTGKPGISDNDGLWTQVYLGSLALCYAVTKDEKVLEAARRTMNAMAYLTKVTGKKGFTARAVRFEGDDNFGVFVNEECSEWHPSPDGISEWLGETSSDEMVGHFFGFSLYYDFCANEEEKEYIREIICDIVDHMLENEYKLCDIDGLPTTWANWAPDQLNGNNMWLWEKCINSLEMLTFLDVAYHVSGDKKYRDEFMHLAIDEHYIINAAQHKKDDGRVCHIDDNLGFLTTATILRIEKDPAIRKYLLMGLRHHWEYERPEHTIFFNLVCSAFCEEPCDLDNAIKELRNFPLDFVRRPLINSKRRGLVYDTEQEKWGGTRQLKEALEIDERIIHYNDRNMYRVDEGNITRASSPSTYLLPYWFGRYYGLIEEAE